MRDVAVVLNVSVRSLKFGRSQIVSRPLPIRAMGRRGPSGYEKATYSSETSTVVAEGSRARILPSSFLALRGSDRTDSCIGSAKASSTKERAKHKEKKWTGERIETSFLRA